MKTNHAIRICAATLLLTACSASPSPSTTDELPGGAVTLWTDSTELFMEHPALIVGAPDKFAVHLTALRDFRPLQSGRITLTFTPRDGGAPVVVTQDAPRAPGIYGPAPTFTRPGVYDLRIDIASPQLRDRLDVPGLTVYATAADVPTADEASTPGISFLKEQQWKTPGFRTVFAAEGDLAANLEATGTIEAAPGRFAHVSASVSGIVDAAAASGAPVVGQSVSRGQVLARLLPSITDGGSAYADARARLREAEDEYARARRLVEAGAAPARRSHEAEIRLTAAREAMAAFAGGADDGRIDVRAPIGGTVASRQLVPGGRVEAGAALFTIVDPSVVWLRVDVPAVQAAAMAPRSGVDFRVDGSDRWITSTTMVGRGRVIDSVSRTLPVRFAVTNADGAVPIGAQAAVLLRSTTVERGIVLPASAIVDDDGEAVVYVQPEGELFERRVVTVGPRTATRVLVKNGIRAGERVVTGAAAQVRLASRSSSLPTHGHEH